MFDISNNFFINTPNNKSYSDAISVTGSHGVISDNVMRWTQAPAQPSDGIQLVGPCEYVTIDGNTIVGDASYDNLKVGVYLHESESGAKDVKYVTISNNVIRGFKYVGEGVGGDCSRGICLTGAPDCVVIGNIIDDYYEAGIRINKSPRAVVAYNKILNGYAGGYGIWESGDSANSTIVGNDLTECTSTNLIIITSSSVKVERNRGFVTEASGTATVANGDYIAHGLAGTPTTVILTCLNATYDGVPVVVNCDYANTNSTHICVSLYWTNGTAITTPLLVSWYVEYKP